MRGSLLIVLTGVVLAGCSHEPIQYIPASDRALLQAQARLGDGVAGSGKISVEDLLRKARGAAPAPGTGGQAGAPSVAGGEKLVLQFAAGATQPDPAQRDQLHRFATASLGKKVAVLSQAGEPESGSVLLAQRRAMAVARELSATLPSVEVHFADSAPPDAVIVTAGAAPAGIVQK